VNTFEWRKPSCAFFQNAQCSFQVMGILLGSAIPTSLAQGSRVTNIDNVNHVAIALENASIHDRLIEAAVTDPLTGLPNRRLFSDRVNHALARRGRSGKGVAVLFLDLDGRVEAILGPNETADLPEGEFDRVVLGFLPSSLAWIDRERRSVTQSQLRILEAAYCPPSTPAQPCGLSSGAAPTPARCCATLRPALRW
jgi:type II secretory pathway pseudopilin PulG